MPRRAVGDSALWCHRGSLKRITVKGFVPLEFHEPEE